MSAAITALCWFIAIWLVVGSLGSVANVGKPRKPLTPGIAVASIVMSVLVAWLLVTR